jgi:GTP-binding protein
MTKRNAPEPPKIVEARFLAGSTTGNLPPPIGLEIAFAGRSNVGKSSLLNSLTGRRNLVRTSSTPGCTRQISLFEVVLKDGPRITFADLPGYGYAKRSRQELATWGPMIDQYLLERPSLGLAVLLVDLRRGLSQGDRDLLAMVASPPRTSRPPLPLLVVATKLDKVPAAARKAGLAKLARETASPTLGFSTRLPDTRGAVWKMLLTLTGFAQGAEPTASLDESSRSQSP